MRFDELRAYANSVLVFLFFLAFNVLSNDFTLLKNISKASAVAAAILLAITLLLGPLSRFFPKKFRHDLVYRKPVGLSGFFFALLHTLVAFFNTYNADLAFVFSPENRSLLAAIFGTIGMAILLIPAVTSTPKAIRKLGFARWKTLQRTAYIAILFALLHFSLVGGGYFLKSTTGKAVLALCLIALLAKLSVIILGITKQHSNEEINHLMKK